MGKSVRAGRFVESLESRRLFAAGAFDTSFGGTGYLTHSFGVAQEANDTLIQADGKIVVVGSVIPTAGAPRDPFIARYNADGTIDGTFGTNGVNLFAFPGDTAAEDFATCVTQQADGKLVAGWFLGGSVTVPNAGAFGAARFNTNGTLDNSFDTDGRASPVDLGGVDFPTGIAVDANQKIWLVGTTAGPNGLGVGMTRLLPTGSIDTTFNQPGDVVGRPVDAPPISSGTGYAAGKVAFDSSGRAVVAITQLTGTITSSTITIIQASMGVARYLATGAPDTSFSGDGKEFAPFGRKWEFAGSVAIDPRNGRIILAGTTGTGTLAFGGALPPGVAPYKVATRANYAIAAFSPAGALDTKFHFDGKVQIDFTDIRPPTGTDLLDGATDVMVDANGLITVSGASQFRKQATDFSVCRLTPKGGFDASFDTDGRRIIDLQNLGQGDAGIASAIQTDGKAVLVGFLQLNKTRRRVALIRLLDE